MDQPTKNMPYSVITFIEDNMEYVSACPTSWLDPGSNKCLWPSNAKTTRKAINLNMQPEKDWKSLKVLRIYGRYGTLNEALAVEKKKQNFSSSESEVAPDKRKITKNVKYRDWSISPPPSMVNKKNPGYKQVEEYRQIRVDDDAKISEDKDKQVEEYRQIRVDDDGEISEDKDKQVEEYRQIRVDDDGEISEDKGFDPNDMTGGKKSRNLNSNPDANVVASPTMSNSSLLCNDEVRGGCLNPDAERISSPIRTISNNSGKSNSSGDYDYIIATLNELKTLVMYTVRKVDLIEKQLGSGITEKKSAGTKLMNCLPIKDLQGLQNLEEELIKSETLKMQLLQFLKYSGGATSKDCIIRCLEKIFTNHVAQSCSWTGRKNNFKLSNLNLMFIVKDAVKENFPNATDESYEKVVMMWFQHACTRIKRGKN